MNDFMFYNPVRIHFGREAMGELEGELSAVGQRILLVYGGGSIKRTGLYDRVMEVMRKLGKEVFELPGVMPNPRAEKVYEGIELCRKHGIEFMLAVGGGSTIDCTKAISVGACTEKDFWTAFFKNKEKAEAAIPFGTVLTIPATGSEFDKSAVVTNMDTHDKNDYTDPFLYPKFTILDPTLTYTLPKNQMVNGVIDTMSHLYELYISPPDTLSLTDALSEAAMRTEIESARIAIREPENYIARANMMWTSSVALCGITGCGKATDWESHCIEHTLSALYDVPHGAGLAVVHPAFLAYTIDACTPRLARLAVNVWGVSPAGKSEKELAQAAIDATRAFFHELGAPITLTELGVPESGIEAAADLADLGCCAYRRVTRDDVVNILRSAL